jgi:hypothetical protein
MANRQVAESICRNQRRLFQEENKDSVNKGLGFSAIILGGISYGLNFPMFLEGIVI